uniref:NADH:ubiquinone reductase (H(+)-translocating) n=1 Tax=Orthocoelium streptocoelium TaxID=123225 RepID=A0A0N7AGB5_ORTSR|nr:NADH dehydrogenase subunit 5 [Orthocoelium streptocoelium]AJG03073.1 NADH dehydrogenase subunit 5 [Orthocoelium streptocoelium]
MLGLLVFLFFGVLCIWCVGLVGWWGSLGLVNYVLKDLMFCFFIDETSLISVFMLFCCGSIALYYCYHYFTGSDEGGLLFPLIVWFLGVMGVLIFTSSMVFSLVLWEYLGLVSFFLILFYSNSSSMRASLITVFASRFGDASLFVLIMWFANWLEYSGFLFLILYLMVVLSKSAAYPFISWLLEAMRAPTPVSSLVHSSTLVAAGAWFVYRYNYFCDSGLLEVLFFFSLVSVIITGLCAVVFMDLKKIVALSTCNNVAWCLIFFVCGDLVLALLQLLTHGVCKCYLFMAVGDLMSSSGSSQSGVGVYLSRYAGVYGVVLQLLLVFSLCGLPFLGVFFSKHGLFCAFLYNYSFIALVGLLIGFLISYLYSTRLALFLFMNVGGLNYGYSSSFMLIGLISFFGTVVNYGGSCLYVELYELSIMWGIGFSVLQLVGCLLGALLFVYNVLWGSGVWESLLWGNDCVVMWLYNIYLRVSESCVFSFYRWEVYLLGLWSGYDRLGVKYRFSLFSLNVLVVGVAFVMVLFIMLS